MKSFKEAYSKQIKERGGVLGNGGALLPNDNSFLMGVSSYSSLMERPKSGSFLSKADKELLQELHGGDECLTDMF